MRLIVSWGQKKSADTGRTSNGSQGSDELPQPKRWTPVGDFFQEYTTREEALAVREERLRMEPDLSYTEVMRRHKR